MTTLELAKLVEIKLALLMAYIPAVSLAGFFQAWVAKKLGDDTPEQLGFLTFNPLVHIDMLGLLFLFLVDFGFPRMVPVHPSGIHGRFKWLKDILLFMSSGFVYFVLMLLGLAALAVVGKFFIAHGLQTTHGMSGALMTVLSCFFKLMFILCVFATISGLTRLLLHTAGYDIYTASPGVLLLLLGLTFLMFIVLSGPLQTLLLYAVGPWIKLIG